VQVLSSLFRAARWKSEPDQQTIVSLILDGARHLATEGKQGAPIDIRDLLDLQREMAWSDKEMMKRFAHAVSTIGQRADRKTYVCAIVLAKGLDATWRH
jgi:hypothetical protein